MTEKVSSLKKITSNLNLKVSTEYLRDIPEYLQVSSFDEKVSSLRKISSTLCKKASKESLLDNPEYLKRSTE